MHQSSAGQLTPQELERYSRHILLPQIGMTGQLKLRAAKVLIVGVGGLGCPCAQYLCAAGVGQIGLLDPDIVNLSNLQRQVLFCVEDIGRLKVEVAREKLLRCNPDVEMQSLAKALIPSNAVEIVSQYDIVVDGTDSFASRYLINDACVITERPFVAASLSRFEGQLGVFNAVLPDGSRSGTYRCIFPEPPLAADAPNCAEAGVFGALPGVMGSLQALEVIKLICAAGESLVGHLLVFDALTMQSRKLSFARDLERAADLEILKNYDEFSACRTASAQDSVPVISPRELSGKMRAGDKITLIDVREPFEREICSIGGELIPQREIYQNINKIPRTGEVVLYCRSGCRSGHVVRELMRDYGYTNLINLEGGIMRWALEVDPGIAVY